MPGVLHVLRGVSVPNQSLRRVLSEKGMTPRQLAEAANVDAKTVERWIADPGRFPHPRTRWTVCDVLGVDEMVLWPEAVRSHVKVGPDREIEQTWPVRADMPNALWGKLLGAAHEEITLAGWTCYFLWMEVPRLRDRLVRKVAEGCRVRFLIGDPADPATAEREAVERTPLTLSVRIAVTLAELGALRGVDGIEARYADRRLMGLSVFRFGQKAVVTPHLATTVGKDSPTLLLRKLTDDGLFTQFTSNHVDVLWTDARPVW